MVQEKVLIEIHSHILYWLEKIIQAAESRQSRKTIQFRIGKSRCEGVRLTNIKRPNRYLTSQRKDDTHKLNMLVHK